MRPEEGLLSVRGSSVLKDLDRRENNEGENNEGEKIVWGMIYHL